MWLIYYIFSPKMMKKIITFVFLGDVLVCFSQANGLGGCEKLLASNIYQLETSIDVGSQRMWKFTSEKKPDKYFFKGVALVGIMDNRESVRVALFSSENDGKMVSRILLDQKDKKNYHLVVSYSKYENHIRDAHLCQEKIKFE